MLHAAFLSPTGFVQVRGVRHRPVPTQPQLTLRIRDCSEMSQRFPLAGTQYLGTRGRRPALARCLALGGKDSTHVGWREWSWEAAEKGLKRAAQVALI